MQNSNLREKDSKNWDRGCDVKSQVRVNGCGRSPPRSRINSARRRQFRPTTTTLVPGKTGSARSSTRRRIIIVATRLGCRGCWYEPPPSSSSLRAFPHLRDSAMRDAIHGIREYENPIMREPRFREGPFHLVSVRAFGLYMFIIYFRVIPRKLPALFRVKDLARARLFSSPLSPFHHPPFLFIPLRDAFASTFGEKDER